jgi:integral membrane protein
MVTTEERDTPAAGAKVSLRGPLLRYRVMAYATGVALLCLTLAIILKYAADSPAMMSWAGVTHGLFYMVYLVLAVDLALKARWSIKGTLLVLIAGTIPFLSFVAERKVTHRIDAGAKL